MLCQIKCKLRVICANLAAFIQTNLQNYSNLLMRKIHLH